MKRATAADKRLTCCGVAPGQNRYPLLTSKTRDLLRASGQPFDRLLATLPFNAHAWNGTKCKQTQAHRHQDTFRQTRIQRGKPEAHANTHLRAHSKCVHPGWNATNTIPGSADILTDHHVVHTLTTGSLPVWRQTMTICTKTLVTSRRRKSGARLTCTSSKLLTCRC